jgi:recombination protein RecA
VAKDKEKKTSEEVLEPAVDILRKIQAEKESQVYGIQMLEGTKIENVPRSSSGVLSVDIALGGGYPLGRVIEIYGPESGGKTTLALHAISEVNRRGGTACFIDLEHALDPAYGKVLGVDWTRTPIAQPDSAEHALNLVEHLCGLMKSGDMIVVDSVAALTPMAELEGEMGDSHMGLQARLMSQALRKLTHMISNSGVIVIFINQLRMKIGVMFGNPETTTGGNALKFYASQRLDVRAGTKLKGVGENAPPVGQVTHVKVVKNKVSMPFRNTDVDLYYGWGFLPAADIFTTGKRYGVIDAAGSWYSFGDVRLGQGEVAAKTFLGENAEIREAIKKAVLDKEYAAAS